MKKIIVFTVFLLSLLSCKKIDEWTRFDMDFNEQVIIESSVGVNIPFNIPTPDITTNSESVFESNHTHKDLLEEVQLKTLELKILNPTNSDFGFLKSIKIYMSAADLPEILIASNTNVAESVGNTLYLEPEIQNLKEYIKKDQYKLRLETITDEIFLQDQTINVYTLFFVDAKILGI